MSANLGWGSRELGLLWWWLISLAINLAGWVAASILKSEMFYDALGSTTFITLTLGSFFVTEPYSSRKILITILVMVWAIRLGFYLVRRIHKVGKDARFDDIKGKPLFFLVFWVMQAIWVWLTLCPLLIVNGLPAISLEPLAWWDLFGISVWVVGFGFEAISDWQKDEWRSHPENKGKYITVGLWGISRHPNYFGEALLWWGIFILCAVSFDHGAQFASVLGPIFVFVLVRFLSGVPILEKTADVRWGNLPEYHQYKNTVPVFFPMPFPNCN